MHTNWRISVMKPNFAVAPIGFLCWLLVSAISMAGEESPMETVRQFYKSYLDFSDQGDSGKPRPALPFSKSLRSLIEENSKMCASHATEVCGWGADGDPYLDTQEIDPLLNYENSGIVISDKGHGVVQVNLNVYPSEKQNRDYYNKTITYRMIHEAGHWVVDDVIYADGASARKLINDEIQYYMSNSNPGFTATEQSGESTEK